jgi:hypothetical protein
VSDPRTTALRDGVEVPGGTPHTVARGRMPLRHSPSRDAVQDDELLFGETITVFESRDGWAWCQSGSDRYVG